MKKVHIGFHSYTNSEIVEEVANVLCRDNFNVEIYGVSEYAKHLPSSYQIVDYLGRDTLLVCEDENIIDDECKIAEWEEKNCY